MAIVVTLSIKNGIIIYEKKCFYYCLMKNSLVKNKVKAYRCRVRLLKVFVLVLHSVQGAVCIIIRTYVYVYMSVLASVHMQHIYLYNVCVVLCMCVLARCSNVLWND